MTREAEWDDHTREQHLALLRYEQECCPGCGIHQSILDDPKHNVFTFEDRRCAVCAASDLYGRVTRARHEAADKDLAARQPHAADGHHTLLRRVAADSTGEDTDG